MAASTTLTLNQIASALQYAKARLGSGTTDAAPSISFTPYAVLGADVNGVVSDIYSISSTLPLGNYSTGAIGTSTALSREDHKHPMQLTTDTQLTTDESTKLASTKYVADKILSKVIYSQVADVTVTNTITETTLFSGVAEVRTIPANTLKVGDILCIETCGKMSTQNSSQTAQVKLKFNSVELLDSSQLTLSGVTMTNDLFVNRFIVKVTAIGATGSIACYGYTMIHTGTGIQSFTGREIVGVAKTIDTTQGIVIDETYTWGAANASNTITMSTVLIQRMN